ncbi:MAG: hypothetical protein MHMPM18_003974, partial [Marteilia pararefringens]
ECHKDYQQRVKYLIISFSVIIMVKVFTIFLETIALFRGGNSISDPDKTVCLMMVCFMIQALAYFAQFATTASIFFNMKSARLASIDCIPGYDSDFISHVIGFMILIIAQF